jgi:hypothetical protein
LHDYLIKENLGMDLSFHGDVWDRRETNVLSGIKRTRKVEPDLLIGIYSDYTTNFAAAKDYAETSPYLQIDASILKNCTVPLTKKEKNVLKRKYKVNTEEPIVVVGFADYNLSEVTDFIHSTYKFSQIYVVADTTKEDLDISKKEKKKVKIVKKWGILKDYYAIADLAINADNLEETTEALHNFVEATEGGPFFLVPPTNLDQYGYKEMVELGLIKAYEDRDALLYGVQVFLKNFEGNKNHVQKRRKHINQIRKKYLPVRVCPKSL